MYNYFSFFGYQKNQITFLIADSFVNNCQIVSQVSRITDATKKENVELQEYPILTKRQNVLSSNH